MPDPLEWLLPGGERVGLNNCDREPIHVPEAIQSHGALLALDPETLLVRRYSAKVPTTLGIEGEEIVGASIGALWGQNAAEMVTSVIEDVPRLFSARLDIESMNGTFDLVAHRVDGQLIVELEPAVSMEQLLKLTTLTEESTSTIATLMDVEALHYEVPRMVARLLGYDRVMLYRFDREGSGEVVGEVCRSDWEPYLGLRYPATDIPQQARRLYVLNPVRAIKDAHDPGQNLRPKPDAGEPPLNLSYAQTRAVSPIHLEYLRNMGVRASLSASIIVGGWLDGLIACHHGQPTAPAYPFRQALTTIGRAVSAQLRHLESERARLEQTARHGIQLLFMRHFVVNPSPLAALNEASMEALELVRAEAFIARVPEGTIIQGDRALAEKANPWVESIYQQVQDRMVVTDRVTEEFTPPPPGEPGPVAGLILVPLGDFGYLGWLRTEYVRTVAWGGKPQQKNDEAPYLSPRKSFSRWEEMVTGKSRPWSAAEVDVTQLLHRSALHRLGGKRAEMRSFDEILANMSRYIERLERSNEDFERFAYAASHDLQAPLRTIRGFMDLIESGVAEAGGLPSNVQPFWPPVVRAVDSMHALLDGILEYSRVGRLESAMDEVDLDRLMKEVQFGLGALLRETQGEIEAGPLPKVHGSWPHLHILFQNLIENALKYSREGVPPCVKVSAQLDWGRWSICIEDNGRGIPKELLPRAFELFKRIDPEKTPGSGIGLTLCKRIVHVHGGSLEADSVLGRGTTFRFTLPSP